MNNETTILDADLSHWVYIDSLRKREGNALGFIPKDTYLSVLGNEVKANRARYLYQDCIMTQDNDEPTGFCYFSYAGELAHIFQIVVQEDSRRWYRAFIMVTEVEDRAKRYGLLGVSCRVAFDLEANFFWKAMGYEPIRETVSTWLNQKESQSKRKLIVYEKLFMPLFDKK